MKSVHYGWWIVVACCAIGCCNGLVLQVCGNFFQPVAATLGTGIGALSFYVTISSLTMAILLPTVGKYLRQYLKPMLLLSGMLQLGAMASMSLFQNVYQFWIAGFFMGLGNAVNVSMAIPILVNIWFVEKRGVAMGIPLSMVGIAAAMFSAIAGYGIEAWGWRTAYLFLAACGAALYFPSVVCLVKTPKELNMKPYGAEVEQSSKSVNTNGTTELLSGISFAEAKRHYMFYCMLICAAMLSAAVSGSTQISTFATGHFGFSTSQAALVLSCYSIGSMAGSLLIGILDDRWGHRKVWLLAIVMLVCAQGVLLTGKTMPACIPVAILIYGFSAASYNALLPLMTNTIFGNLEYSRIWSCIMAVGSVAGAVAIPLYGTVYDHTGAYTIVFFALGIFGMLSGLNGYVSLKGAESGKNRMQST